MDGKRGVSSAATKESAERAAKLAMTDDLVSSTIVSNSIMALSQMSQSKRDRIDRMMPWNVAGFTPMHRHYTLVQYCDILIH